MVALILGTAAFGTMQAEELSSGVGEAVRENGFKAKPAGIQAMSVSSYDHGDPTAYEQLFLELLNRARANPGAEASRLGINLNAGLPAGTIANTPKPPLAFEEALIAASRAHSQWMLDTDTFSHTGTNGTSSSQRMTAAGYPLDGAWKTGENIAWRGTSGTVNIESFTRGLHDDLFKSFSHRINMMDPAFDQIGLGVIQGLFQDNGTNWKALMGTQDFAFSGGSPSPAGPLVLGVAYKDNNGNNFYDPGEGLGGVTVNLLPGDTTTTTSTSGGYAIPLGTTSGALVLTFSGGAVTTSTQVAGLAVPGVNVKVDLILAPTSTTTRVVSLSGDLNFGSVAVGSSVTRTLSIANTGNSPLVVTGISHSSGVFSGNFSGTITAGNSKMVTLTFTPTAIQAFSGTLTVASNATSGTATRAETGTGTNAPVAATPVINPNGASFGKSVKVKLTSATTGAVIRYTKDGSEPTSASPKYSRTIPVKTTTTIKAKAFKAGFTESHTATALFTKS